MSRVPWDDLPGSWIHNYVPKHQVNVFYNKFLTYLASYYNNLRSSIYKDQITSSTSHSETTTTNESTIQIDEPIKRNFMKELDGIGRRVAFGGIVSLHLFTIISIPSQTN